MKCTLLPKNVLLQGLDCLEMTNMDDYKITSFVVPSKHVSNIVFLVCELLQCVHCMQFVIY